MSRGGASYDDTAVCAANKRRTRATRTLMNRAAAIMVETYITTVYRCVFIGTVEILEIGGNCGNRVAYCSFAQLFRPSHGRNRTHPALRLQLHAPMIQYA